MLNPDILPKFLVNESIFTSIQSTSHHVKSSIFNCRPKFRFISLVAVKPSPSPILSLRFLSTNTVSFQSNPRHKMSNPRSPIAVQVSLHLARNSTLTNPKLLATNFPIPLITRDVYSVHSAIRRRRTIDSSHRTFCFDCARQINKTVALTRSSDRQISMNQEYAFADCLDVVAVEQLPHLRIDELLFANVADTSDVESSSFFDWFRPVFTRIFSKRMSRRRVARLLS